MSRSEESRKIKAPEGETLESPTKQQGGSKGSDNVGIQKKKPKLATDSKDSPSSSRNGSRKNSDDNLTNGGDSLSSSSPKDKHRKNPSAELQKSKFNYSNNTKTKKPSQSILKKTKNNDESSTRQDANGNPILKGGRKHKISFKDKVEDVKVVENWKEYNADNYTTSTCYCNIF